MPRRSSCCRRSTSAAVASSGCAQGDFERETAYGDDPVAVAARFVAQGATWLHVVDLDGATSGEPRQLDTAAAIVAEVHGRARVELGRRAADRRSPSPARSGPGRRG